MSKDFYKTIKKVSEGLYKDKGSKFFSFAFPIESEEDVKQILKDTKKKFHDARHHCYAYRIGAGEGAYRLNDDGEPSGTAGKPIFGQILSYDLSDILIVVVRYFGGTLLGTSGLINAYKNSTIDAINNAAIVEKVLKKKLTILFSYEIMSIVMRLIKDENIDIVSQNFTTDCRITLEIRENDFETIKQKLLEIYGVEEIKKNNRT